MKPIRPFLDHYGALDISPVAQDISDRQRHFNRRASLYRSLGVPPLYVAGRAVVEFGPGSGHNALYTQSLGPSRYVLIDANPRGVNDTRSMLETADPQAAHHEMVLSTVEEFATEERFALVLAEGLVAFQLDPPAFIRTIGEFTAPGGILVLTCSDAPNIMGEVSRRLIATKFVDVGLPAAERVRRLARLFGPHLATLKGMSRSVDDWIYDNILNPFVGRTFGIDEAIVALSDDFVAYGSSPEFVTDWRWYKELHGEERRFNELAIRAYLSNMLNFLDCRVALPTHDLHLGRAIQAICTKIYVAMQRIEASHGALPVTMVGQAFRELASLARPSPRTAAALEELANTLESDPGHEPSTLWHEFPSFFGRGMQYLSFIRMVND